MGKPLIRKSGLFYQKILDMLLKSIIFINRT